MASRGRVTAYLPEEIQKALEEWAEEDSRSVSSLATYLLTKSVRERQQLKKDKSESDRPQSHPRPSAYIRLHLRSKKEPPPSKKRWAAAHPTQII
ncbi:hypothetical protein QUB47_10140 [Microcoleus sp. AT9_B5]